METGPAAVLAPPSDADMLKRAAKAVERRGTWESHWRECYDFALPQREPGLLGRATPGAKRTNALFDGTAPDAVEQLAASLLAELTPPWGKWFGLTAGAEIAENPAVARVLEDLQKATDIVQSHFDRSNLAVELHQCYLDLVTAGTACLLFEEAPAGGASAFRFTAVPIGCVAMAEGPDGRLDTNYRFFEWTVETVLRRYPKARLPAEWTRGEGAGERLVKVTECVVPRVERGTAFFDYRVLAQMGDAANDNGDVVRLNAGHLKQSPFINFRWVKSPGETYGRSPVMKALPDIKTANKVVELVLKNATIAITGIWQADDDGVLNPATIKFVPGTIIPKAVGSQGLQPLKAPGQFDVSQLVLEQLQDRIRHALMADRLAQLKNPRMTATEVLERTSEMARLLGATYGRLQEELLSPIVARGLFILGERGDLPEIRVDGRLVDLQYKSPLAQATQQQNAQQTAMWAQTSLALGGDAALVVDGAAFARWMAEQLGVPAKLMRSDEDIQRMQQEFQAAQAAAARQSSEDGGVPAEAAGLAVAGGAAP